MDLAGLQRTLITLSLIFDAVTCLTFFDSFASLKSTIILRLFFGFYI